MMYNIEDILHLLVDTVGVENADNSILTSISRQCKRGIALTDRQYELVKNKLLEHKDALIEHGAILDGELPARLPLRTIDRSKTIGIVSHSEMLGPDSAYENYKENWLWIKLRFPFSKKLIVKLENVKTQVGQSVNVYYHKKGSHEHYFKLKGDAAYYVMESFKGANFEIEDRLTEYYQKSKHIVDNHTDFLMYYSNGNFSNMPEEVVEQMSTYTEDLIIVDRRMRYGYQADTSVFGTTLTEQIACRETQVVNADPELFDLTTIADSLKQLNRFPMLVLIDQDSPLDQVKAVHQAFDFIDNSLQSVLFRVDSSSQYNVNDYIKDNKLNNWVDNTTQIVYIKKNQLPKVLFDNGFEPITALGLNSYRCNTHVDTFCKFNCDLILYHDKEKSVFEKLGTRLYANL